MEGINDIVAIRAILERLPRTATITVYSNNSTRFITGYTHSICNAMQLMAGKILHSDYECIRITNLLDLINNRVQLSLYSPHFQMPLTIEQSRALSGFMEETFLFTVHQLTANEPITSNNSIINMFPIPPEHKISCDQIISVLIYLQAEIQIPRLEKLIRFTFHYSNRNSNTATITNTIHQAYKIQPNNTQYQSYQLIKDLAQIHFDIAHPGPPGFQGHHIDFDQYQTAMIKLVKEKETRTGKCYLCTKNPLLPENSKMSPDYKTPYTVWKCCNLVYICIQCNERLQTDNTLCPNIHCRAMIRFGIFFHKGL